MKYAVVIEKVEYDYGAYVPDLQGCIAAGDTKEKDKKIIHEAIEITIEGIKETR